MNNGLKKMLEKRKQEKEWLILNGYVNENPETNGEFKCLNLMSKYIDNFIDIGVNKCLFSNKMYEFNNLIYFFGFEPNSMLHKRIKSQKVFQDNKMKLYPYALSNKEGQSSFFIHNQYDTMASLSIRNDVMPSFNSNLTEINVDVKTLEILEKDIEMTSVTMMKVDVEGYESQLLEGGKKFISKYIDIILFEYSSAWKNTNKTFKEVFHLLDELGFKIYRLTPLGLEYLRFYYDDMDNYTYSNYLAIKSDTYLEALEVFDIEQKYGKSKFFQFKDIE